MSATVATEATKRELADKAIAIGRRLLATEDFALSALDIAIGGGGFVRAPATDDLVTAYEAAREAIFTACLGDDESDAAVQGADKEADDLIEQAWRRHQEGR